MTTIKPGPISLTTIEKALSDFVLISLLIWLRTDIYYFQKIINKNYGNVSYIQHNYEREVKHMNFLL